MRGLHGEKKSTGRCRVCVYFSMQVSSAWVCMSLWVGGLIGVSSCVFWNDQLNIIQLSQIFALSPKGSSAISKCFWKTQRIPDTDCFAPDLSFKGSLVICNRQRWTKQDMEVRRGCIHRPNRTSPNLHWTRFLSGRHGVMASLKLVQTWKFLFLLKDPFQ